MKRGLKFDEKHVDSLLYGDKCITARLPAEIPNVEEGESIMLLTPGGHHFGNAVVDRISEMRLSKFVNLRLDGHKTYAMVGELVREMNEYYPDRMITSAHNLEVIWLRDIEEV